MKRIIILFLVSMSVCMGEQRSHKAQTAQPENYVMKKMVVTGYCADNCYICCGKWAKFGLNRKFPDGTRLKDGIKNGAIAAPKSIRFGTKIAVPGYRHGKPVTVHDRGGAIKGNRLDLLFPTHREAKRWGRQTLEVRIYDPKNNPVWRNHYTEGNGVIPGKSICTGDYTKD